MGFEERKGKSQAVVKKAFVDLSGKAFAYFQKERKAWELQDEYRFSGPIQFSGDPAVTSQPPLSLLLDARVLP
jgi:pyrophosphate--fructose-6-phosphate 1-phosphotransferase